MLRDMAIKRQHAALDPVGNRKPWADLQPLMPLDDAVAVFIRAEIAVTKDADAHIGIGIERVIDGHDGGVLDHAGGGDDGVSQAGPLFARESVGADHADADALGVAALHVRADLLYMPTRLHTAIQLDDIVVADVPQLRVEVARSLRAASEAALLVHAVDVCRREVLAVRSCRAMDDDGVEFSLHCFSPPINFLEAHFSI